MPAAARSSGDLRDGASSARRTLVRATTSLRSRGPETAGCAACAPTPPAARAAAPSKTAPTAWSSRPPTASSRRTTWAPRGEFLIATNSGSKNITVFRVRRHRLQRIEVQDAKGFKPVSVTVSRGLPHVLSSGEVENRLNPSSCTTGFPPTVTGFRLSARASSRRGPPGKTADSVSSESSTRRVRGRSVSPSRAAAPF